MFRMISAGPVVLFYHGIEERIIDPAVQKVQMALSLFERQVAFLRQHREVISLDDLNEGVECGYRLDPRQVVLTFDDGYKNNLRLVAPLLRSWNLPFTIFVSTRHISEHLRFPMYLLRVAILYTETVRIYLRCIDRGFDLSTRQTRLFAADVVTETAKQAPPEVLEPLIIECMELLPSERWTEMNARFSSEEPMTWADVLAVSSMGATIGSHCHDHCILHDNLSQETVVRQVCESKKAINRNLWECRYFAYPNGTASDISAMAYRAVKSARYCMAFTTICGEITPCVDRFLAPRFSAAVEYEEFCYMLNRSSKQNEFYNAACPLYARPGSQGELL